MYRVSYKAFLKKDIIRSVSSVEQRKMFQVDIIKFGNIYLSKANWIQRFI